MALTFTQLFQPAQLTTSAAGYYTCPASPGSTVLKNGRVRFTNTSASAVAVTAYAVPKGGSAGVSNMFLNAESIAPNAHMDVDIPTLASGDMFQALASAATSVTVSEIGGVLFS
jgi:hypothetical protein